MQKVLKVVIGIVILIAIGFGVYQVLPEYPKSFVKSFVQPLTDARAKERITSVQNLKNQDVGDKDAGGVTYKEILEKNTGMSSWIYETYESEPGVEYVIYNGKGASINLKDYTEYNGKMTTSCFVKFVFKITGNNVEIYPYIDGVKMSIDDNKHTDENKAIRLDILTQLYEGMRSN